MFSSWSSRTSYRRWTLIGCLDCSCSCGLRYRLFEWVTVCQSSSTMRDLGCLCPCVCLSSVYTRGGWCCGCPILLLDWCSFVLCTSRRSSVSCFRSCAWPSGLGGRRFTLYGIRGRPSHSVQRCACLCKSPSPCVDVAPWFRLSMGSSTWPRTLTLSFGSTSSWSPACSQS